MPSRLKHLRDIHGEVFQGPAQIESAEGVRVTQRGSTFVFRGASYACFRDRKTLGTDGGTFTQDAWQTRALNYEQDNDIDDCSLASNQVTIPPGIYQVRCFACANNVDRNKLRIYDTTASAILLEGMSGKCNVAGNDFLAVCEGRFSVDVRSVIELQHRCETTNAGNGFGESTSIGSYEYFAEMHIWQIEE
jgi:hypothetical protein